MFRFGIQKKKHASTILELIILRILLDKRRMHGYEIQKQIMQLLNRTWHPSFSLLYPLLKNMQNRKLIKRIVSSRGRKKVYEYEITDEGRKYYVELLELLKRRTYEILGNNNDDYSAMPLLFFTTDIGAKLLFEIFSKDEIIRILDALDRFLKRLEKRKMSLWEKLKREFDLEN